MAQDALRVAAVAPIRAGKVKVRAARAGAAALPEAPAVVVRQGQSAQARHVQRHGIAGMPLAIAPDCSGPSGLDSALLLLLLFSLSLWCFWHQN